MSVHYSQQQTSGMQVLETKPEEKSKSWNNGQTVSAPRCCASLPIDGRQDIRLSFCQATLLAYIHVGQDNRITELWPYLSSVHIVRYASERDIMNVHVKIFHTMAWLSQNVINLWYQRFHFTYSYERCHFNISFLSMFISLISG